MSGPWNSLDRSALREFGIFDDSIRLLLTREPDALPDLRGAGPLWVGSDYGGDHQSSDFSITSALFTQPLSGREWQAQRLAIRRQYLGRRTMAFKKSSRRKETLPASAR
jgi:hypothetical protein